MNKRDLENALDLHHVRTQSGQRCVNQEEGSPDADAAGARISGLHPPDCEVQSCVGSKPPSVVLCSGSQTGWDSPSHRTRVVCPGAALLTEWIPPVSNLSSGCIIHGNG